MQPRHWFFLAVVVGLVIILPQSLSVWLFWGLLLLPLGLLLARYRTVFTAIKPVLPSRAIVYSSLGVLAWGAMCLQAYVFYAKLELPLWQVVGALVVGGVALWGALWLRPITLPQPIALTFTWEDWRWGWGLAGMVLLLVVGESSARLLGVQFSPHWQFLLFLGGIFCLSQLDAKKNNRSIPRPELLAISLITLVALGLRLWRLDSSIRVMVDEILFVEGIMKYWHQDKVPLVAYIGDIAKFSQVFSYLQAWSVELLGRSFFGLRFTSAILGTCTIPAVYWVGRTLFDAKIGLLAAAFLASFPLHLHFSRLALNQPGDVLFGTLAVGLLGSALINGRRRDYVLAGICLGLTQYFYEGGRIIFIALLLGWLLWGMLTWRVRPPWQGIVIVVGVGLLAALPWYYWVVGTGNPLVPRLEVAGGTEVSPSRFTDPVQRQAYLEENLRYAVGFYVRDPEWTFYYGGRAPMVLFFMLPPFLLGLCWLLWHWRSPGMVVLLWVVGVALSNSLLRDSNFAPRFMTVTPALALLAAIGLRYGILLLPKRLHSAYVLMGVAGLLVVGQAYFYFGVHLDDFNRQNYAYPDATEPLMRSLEFSPQTYIHVIGEGHEEGYFRLMLAFFVDGRLLYVIPEGQLTATYLRDKPRGVDHAFFIRADDAASLALVRQYFVLQPPQYSQTPFMSPEKGFVLYYARAVDNPLVEN